MQFSEITITNFRCFSDTEVRFEDGVVAIHGSNGAGKSSLLEAVFFALYGSNALPTGVTLGDVITTGEDEAEVVLDFHHNDSRYKLTREIRRRSSGASNTKSVLRADGPVVADGSREVNGYISDLLHMDADAFVNCAYIRQGGVTKLINATPSERQAMIDELLQLGTLEEYRERASKARIGTGRVRDSQVGAVDSLKDQIESKEDQNLETRRDAVATELGRITDAIDDVAERRESAVEARDEAQEVVDAHEERVNRINDIKSEAESHVGEMQAAADSRADHLDTVREQGAQAGTLRGRLRRATQADESTLPTDGLASFDPPGNDADAEEAAGVHFDRDAVQERIESAEASEDEAADAVSAANDRQRAAGEAATAHEGNAVNAAENAASKRERIDEYRDRIDDHGATIDSLDDEIAAKENTISELEAKLREYGYEPDDADAVRETATDRTLTLNDRMQTVQTDIGAAQGQIRQAESLQEEDRCPECGQPVDESPHVTTLDDERLAVERLQAKNQRLEDERDETKEVAEAARELASERDALADLKDDQVTARDDRDAAREKISDLETEIESLHERSISEYRISQEKQEEAAEAEADAEVREKERQQTRKRASNLRTLDTTLSTLASNISGIEDATRRRADLADEIADHREEIHALARERAELESEAGDEAVEQARTAVDRHQGRVNRFDQWDDDLTAMRDERQQTLGEINGSIAELKDLRERQEEAVERADRLDDFYAEMEALEAMYEEVRSDLRQQNIDHLQRILNDIFDELYRNDAYAGIELDRNYEFTVHEKNGETLDPSQLSGGEKVLFNLALRCAIYKLLARGVRGEGSMPPLILDEPTAHLDTGHVSRLSRAIDIMRDLGVSQTIIVSHDDEIVDGADGEIHLTQDATTNRSSVSTPAVGPGLGAPPSP
jgi:exonuclease SbcC